MTVHTEQTKQSGLLNCEISTYPKPLQVSTDEIRSLGKIVIETSPNQSEDIECGALKVHVKLGSGENSLSDEDLSAANAIVPDSSKWKAHYESSGNQGMIVFRPNGDTPYLLSKGQSLTFEINGFAVSQTSGDTSVKLVEVSAIKGEQHTAKVTEFNLWKAPNEQFYLKNFRAVKPGSTDPKPITSIARNNSFELRWEASDVICEVTYGQGESKSGKKIKKNGSAYSCDIESISRDTTFILKAKDDESKQVTYASFTLQAEDPSFQKATHGLVPPGTIVPYFSHSIDRDFKNGLGKKDSYYESWALCDGRNGTPDLRGRFVVGMESSNSPQEHSDASYIMGNTGGEKSHQLTVEEMPKHNHGREDNNDLTEKNGKHHHRYFFYNGWAEAGGKYWKGIVTKDEEKSYDRNTHDAGEHEHKLFPKGGDKPHENRPPYYSLAYIMKLSEKCYSSMKDLQVDKNHSLNTPQPMASEDIFTLYPKGQLDFSNVARIKKIEVKCGNVVDCIKITWEDKQGNLVVSDPFAGHETGGKPIQIEFKEGEYITEISGELRTLWGNRYLSRLIIKTTENEHGPYGYPGELPFKEIFNNTDKRLISLITFPGRFVTQVGFITRNS